MTLTRIEVARIGATVAVELSFCVVNTDQRELLLRCLDAIAAERERLDCEPEVIALERRRGKGENDTALLKRATGRYALLLNEDSELRPGAVKALRDALEAHADAAAAGAPPLRPDGAVEPRAGGVSPPTTA